MKILVLNGAYRPDKTTTTLANSFMEGARAGGAQTEMIMLREQKIGYCTDCLKCYLFKDDGVAPCSLKDDMDEIIGKIVEADGVLFASPVHNGFVTGLMTTFWERLSWRAARPGGYFNNIMSIRTRVNDKVRAFASIASAGGMTELLRKSCDDGTRWLKSNAPLILHGQWVGDIYAGADLERLPESSEDWRRLFIMRRLSSRQLKRAYELGAGMAGAIAGGRLKPVTMDSIFPPALQWLMRLYFVLNPPYRVAGESVKRN